MSLIALSFYQGSMPPDRPSIMSLNQSGVKVHTLVGGTALRSVQSGD
jgi:hypothetical protein